MDNFINEIKTLFEGSPRYVAGQCVGLVIIALSFFIYYCKKREHMLILKCTSDSLGIIQQALIGASTGALITFVNVLRSIVFYNKNRKNWAGHIAWLFIFIAAVCLSPLLTWQGPISLIPAAGSSLAVIAFYCNSPTTTRIFALFAQGLWLLYAILTFNLTCALQNGILVLSALAGLCRDALERRKRKSVE